MNKELIIVLADAEMETVNAVNAIMERNGLPCYLMEPIIERIHRQLLDGKAKELAEAKSKITQEHIKEE